MFEDELTEKDAQDMEILYVLLDALCIKYMLDTGNPVTPFEMNGAIILATFEETFGG